MKLWIVGFLVVSVYCFGVPAHAQYSHTVTDSDRYNWDPSHWFKGANGALDPCAKQYTSGGGYAGDVDQIVGPSGEPSPCTYWHVQNGALSSLAPLLTAILSILVVMLAVWRGPWLFRRLLDAYASRSGA